MLNLNPWTYSNVIYIFGICAPRRWLWVILEVCTTTTTKTVWAKRRTRYILDDVLKFLTIYKIIVLNSYNFSSRGRTDLQKYSNSPSSSNRTKTVMRQDNLVAKVLPTTWNKYRIFSFSGFGHIQRYAETYQAEYFSWEIVPWL